MKKILRTLYKIQVWTCFIVFFLLLYPFFVLFIQRDSWKAKGHFLNKIWAYSVFGYCFLPCEVIFHFKPKKKTPYIYCSNHNSYLDIPSLCYALPGYFKFIGKAALTKVPLFGYMFRNLYIPVDRHNKRSKYETMQMSFQAIDEGRGLAIFPEGTIPKGNHPHMIPFKDGPFRIAIEKKAPIVPVTLPYNWIILPDDGTYTPNRHLMKVIVHEPIETTHMTLDDVGALKNKTYNIIRDELKKHFPEKFIETENGVVDQVTGRESF
ncbi:MAG TPA: lysophospholipid acyltransferase family protein [Cytophagaceae bacterium]